MKIKRKIDPGLIIILSSFIIGISFKMPIIKILKNFLLATADPSTLRLVAIILLILTLGNLLNEGENLKNINHSLETLINDRRITLVIPSVLMGLLPVAAGAMLSAPIVEESGNKMELSAEYKTFLNYWFRHIWEYTWPLYPGLILAAVIFNIPLPKIILAQIPLTLVAILSGIIFGLRKIPFKPSHKKEKTFKEIYRLLFYSWPILSIVVLVLIFKLDMVLSLLLIVFFTFITTKIKRNKVTFILRKILLSWKIILLVVSVMIFKRILENSGILLIIPQILNKMGISLLLVLFFIPFLIGLLMGATQAFVGITFPILLPFIGIDNPNLSYIMLSYAGGFAGVLLSPVHLCLIVTRDYFKSNLIKVYKLLLPPIIFVVSVAFLIVFIYNLL